MNNELKYTTIITYYDYIILRHDHYTLCYVMTIMLHYILYIILQ